MSDYLGKRLRIRLNAYREIVGKMVGYDNYMNIAMENTKEIKKDGTEEEIGKVMIRGCNIVIWECIDKVNLGA